MQRIPVNDAPARISAALRLHPPAGAEDGRCPTCAAPAPCPTATVLRW